MEITWLKHVSEKTIVFLQHQHRQDVPGYFAYSYSGDLFPDRTHSNLAGSVFALKLCHLLNHTPPEIIQPTIKRILSFQRPDGYMVDPFVFQRSFLRNVIRSMVHGQLSLVNNHQYVRAETRQVFSSLLLHGVTPPHMVLDVPTTPESIHRFLQKLDWNRPWGAGSHFSHLLFSLKLMQKMGLLSDESYLIARQTATDFVQILQHPQDGAWYRGLPSFRQKVNGAMKIITGLLVDDLPFAFPNRLIDLCLTDLEPSHDACDQINQVLVLRYAEAACQHTYRVNDIRSLCFKLLKQWQDYYQDDTGGFSFYRHQANHRYYGARITQGLDEPDIHGTVLFIWGLSLMKDLLPLPDLQKLQDMKS